MVDDAKTTGIGITDGAAEARRRVLRSVAALRLPLILGPILVHACLAPRSTPLQYFLARIVGDVAVPALFFTSGLLFFIGWDGSLREYAAKMRRRVISLGVPYVFWNLVCFIVFAYGITIVAKDDFAKAFWAVRVARRQIGTAPVNGPLYFIKDVFLLAAAAPAIALWLRSRTLSLLTPLAAVAWVVWSWPSSHAITTGLTFFSIGAFSARLIAADAVPLARWRMTRILALWFFPCVSAAHLALHVFGIDSDILYRFNILCGIAFAFAVAPSLPEKLADRKCGGAAMWLFCTFEIIMVTLRNLRPWFFGRGDAPCLATAAVTVAISLALYAIVSRIARRTTSLLIGWR